MSCALMGSLEGFPFKGYEAGRDGWACLTCRLERAAREGGGTVEVRLYLGC